MIVKGKTESGIQFQLDSKIKDDVRLIYLLTKASKTEDTMEASTCVMDLFTLIFGSDENVMVFMNEVADKHKGVCTAKEMLAEITEMFDKLKAKNS